MLKFTSLLDGGSDDLHFRADLSQQRPQLRLPVERTIEITARLMDVNSPTAPIDLAY